MPSRSARHQSRRLTVLSNRYLREFFISKKLLGTLKEATRYDLVTFQPSDKDPETSPSFKSSVCPTYDL
jgi:hypothetical protein